MKTKYKIETFYGLTINNPKVYGTLKQGPKPKWYWVVYAAAGMIWLYAVMIFCFLVSIMSFTYLLSGVMQ